MIIITDCGDPSPANGVLIKPYNTTTVGSEIRFQCIESNDLVSIDETFAVCEEDGNWNPDPAMYGCFTTSKFCIHK